MDFKEEVGPEEVATISSIISHINKSSLSESFMKILMLAFKNLSRKLSISEHIISHLLRQLPQQQAVNKTHRNLMKK
jgi:DNA-binding HxlR family transcriptional regulator